MPLSFEPQVKAVQYADWEQQCASNQKAPKTLSKTGEHMGNPCKETSNTDKLIHKFFQRWGYSLHYLEAKGLISAAVTASAFPPKKGGGTCLIKPAINVQIMEYAFPQKSKWNVILCGAA